MNYDLIVGPLRIIVPVLVTLAITKGYITPEIGSVITPDTVGDLIVALVTLGSATWSFFHLKNKENK